MLKIGEIAKKTGVSVRSLRHYDEMGLLKPSSHSESGYRLYTKADILRLQQIVSLKQMRFPLSRIQAMLNQDSVSLQQILQLQQQFLAQQLAQQKALLRRLSEFAVVSSR